MNDSHRNSIISVIAVLFLIGAASLHAALQDSRKEVETFTNSFRLITICVCETILQQ